MIAAGALDRPMRLERPDRIEVGDGEVAIHYEDLGPVHVLLEPARLAERELAGRLDGTATHAARLRHRPDIRGGWRLVDDTRVFRILAVDDGARRKGLLTCMLEEEGR
ncbi:head-tail adaptor protein [Stappia sp. ICDLI1TA098]